MVGYQGPSISLQNGFETKPQSHQSIVFRGALRYIIIKTSTITMFKVNFCFGCYT